MARARPPAPLVEGHAKSLHARRGFLTSGEAPAKPSPDTPSRATPPSDLRGVDRDVIPNGPEAAPRLHASHLRLLYLCRPLLDGRRRNHLYRRVLRTVGLKEESDVRAAHRVRRRRTRPRPETTARQSSPFPGSDSDRRARHGNGFRGDFGPPWRNRERCRCARRRSRGSLLLAVLAANPRGDDRLLPDEAEKRHRKRRFRTEVIVNDLRGERPLDDANVFLVQATVYRKRPLGTNSGTH
jgi:hypothetical protein